MYMYNVPFILSSSIWICCSCCEVSNSAKRLKNQARTLLNFPSLYSTYSMYYTVCTMVYIVVNLYCWVSGPDRRGNQHLLFSPLVSTFPPLSLYLSLSLSHTHYTVCTQADRQNTNCRVSPWNTLRKWSEREREWVWERVKNSWEYLWISRQLDHVSPVIKLTANLPRTARTLGTALESVWVRPIADFSSLSLLADQIVPCLWKKICVLLKTPPRETGT